MARALTVDKRSRSTSFMTAKYKQCGKRHMCVHPTPTLAAPPPHLLYYVCLKCRDRDLGNIPL